MVARRVDPHTEQGSEALVGRRTFLTIVGRVAGAAALGREIIPMGDNPAVRQSTRASSATRPSLAERARTFETYLRAVCDRDGL